MKSYLGFIETLAPRSSLNYLSNLRAFFRVVYDLDPVKTMTWNELENRAKEFFSSNRNYQADVEKFFISLKDRPPLSISSAVSIVKTLLMENDVELPVRFWRGLSRRVKGSRARTLDRIPSNDE